MAHPFSAAGKPLPAEIRTELDRILASELFLRSDRLSAFLRFVVEETLKGDGAALKEHVIAMALYGKEADFNTAADPIVRVDARRLRDKLREFYASSPPGALIISVPKGSYTPVFEPGDPALAFHPPPSAPQITAIPVPTVASRRSRWRWAAAAAIAVVLIGGLAMSLARGRRSAPPRLLTVTSFPGSEDDPSLSPDGNFVAFSWAGPDGGINDDLWVTPVEGDGLRRLTDRGRNRQMAAVVARRSAHCLLAPGARAADRASVSSRRSAGRSAWCPKAPRPHGHPTAGRS